MSDDVAIIFFIRYLDFDAVNEYLTTRKGLLGSAMTLGAFVPTTEESKRDDWPCLLYTSPSPRDKRQSRMPSSA